MYILPSPVLYERNIRLYMHWSSGSCFIWSIRSLGLLGVEHSTMVGLLLVQYLSIVSLASCIWLISKKLDSSATIIFMSVKPLIPFSPKCDGNASIVTLLR